MADGDLAGQPDPGTMPAGSVRGTDSETLGEALSRARRQRGLTVRQINATTKIPIRHLEALERDDIHVVPGGMYLRAEVRAYADAVGLNRSVALGYLQAALDPRPVAVAVPDPVPPASRRAPLGRTVTIAGCLVVAAGIVMWRLDRNARQAPPTRVVSEAPATPEPVRATATTVSTELERTIDAAPQPTVAPVPVPVPAPLPTPAAPNAMSGTTGSAPVPTAENAVATPDQAATPPVGGPELEIVTEPAGARVTIDGVGWGVTPVTIRYLPPGTKQLRVTRDGFAAEERVIRFGTGQPHMSVRIELHQAD